jgi:hypothetical protein
MVDPFGSLRSGSSISRRRIQKWPISFLTVAEALASPDRIVRSRTDPTVELFYKHYASTPVTSKFLCTVVKALPGDNFIIAAYYTDTMKRGEVLWEKT